jgi:hypothetical protein
MSLKLSGETGKNLKFNFLMKLIFFNQVANNNPASLLCDEEAVGGRLY